MKACPHGMSLFIKIKNHSMKTNLFTIFAVAMMIAIPTQAQTAREDIREIPRRAGSNYLAYLDPVKPLTKAPKGYIPFYMSHYGRHGSRWLLGDGDYLNPIRTLRKANELGKLTPEGQKMLADLERFYPTTVRRLGDLTTVGERQHHAIGRRMTERFPEIFKGKAEVDARSTVVVRCILSMTAECEELTAFNPKMKMHNDVSEAFQFYLNHDFSGVVRAQNSNGNRGRAVDKAKQDYTHPERFSALLFNDPQYVADSLNAGSFMRSIFNVATNMQSHDTDIDLLGYFTNDELYDLWKITNIDWYLGYGAAPQTGGVMPFNQANLLHNILETADTIVNKRNWNGATLRFGHEVCVMPLACLLELDSCGVVVEDLETLDQKWVNYRIYPMACNIQLVFYRPKKGDGPILLKALLNENEATLPLPSDNYPYYKWSDFREYFGNKLKDFETKYPEENYPRPQRRR